MDPKTPGVYVNELSSLPPSVAGVATSIPAFIGYTQLHSANVPFETFGALTVTQPTRIESMLEFSQIFGGSNASLTVTVSEPTALAVQIDSVAVAPVKYRLEYALQMYFMNGGGPCYIISVGTYSNSVAKANLKKGIEMLEKTSVPSLILIPDLEEIGGTGTTKVDNFYEVYADAIAHCASAKHRFTLMDLYTQVPATTDPVSAMRDKITGELSFAASYWPMLNTTLLQSYDSSQVSFVQTSGLTGNNPFNGKTLAWIKANLASASPDPDLAQLVSPAFYQALNQRLDDAVADAGTVQMGPSAAVAGVIANTDATRGVWKAPANLGLRGVSSLSQKFSPSELDGLNVHVSGKSVNAIREISGRGTMVMGARTLDGNSNDWRYIQVRRTFIYIEQSVKNALDSFVFASNNAATWAQVKGMISAFLDRLWRDGALLGASPEDAFFVNVGLGQTMTQDDINGGYLKVSVGISAVRPAEFIILDFTQSVQP